MVDPAQQYATSLTIKVYTVNAATLERGPVREVHPKGPVSVFTLGTRWPPCQCPLSHTDPGHAAAVTAAENRRGR